MYEGFNFSTPVSVLDIICLIGIVLLIIEHHTSRDEVVSYLNFSNYEWMVLVIMIIGHLYISLV